MIKILNIVPSLAFGGIESFIYNYYTNMDKSNIHMDFAVYFGDGENIANSKKFEDLGCKIHVLKTSIYKPKEHKKEVKNLIQEGEYDIVYIHTSSAMRSFYGFVAKKCNVKVRIIHSHVSALEIKSRAIMHRCLRWTIPFGCNVLFACSEKAGRHMYGRYKFTVIHNAINTDKFQFNPSYRKEIRDQLGLSENTVLIGNAGRKVPVKNQSFIVDLLAAGIKEGMPLKACIVGRDGGEESKLKKKAKELNVENDLFLIGDTQEIEKYYNAFDVLVFPSFNEGLPLCMVEAQACGCPCIASDTLTREVAITDLVHYLSTDEKMIDQWLKKISEVYKVDRVSRVADIIKSGYDIKEEALKFQAKLESMVSKNVD